MTAEAGNEMKGLRALRDEVKLQAHLAGMELKARLLALQQRLAYPARAGGP